MKYLFEEIGEVRKKVQQADKIFLFLDYDGTLVPIKPRPELAVFPPSTKKLIKKLWGCPKIYLAIVTGRTLKEIKKLIDINGIAYVGNHGFEIEYEKKCWIHPVSAQISPTIRKIIYNIKDYTKEIYGVLIEDKGLIVSIHYRLATDKSAREIKKIVYKVISPYHEMFCVGSGKKVYEIRPCVDWHKGKAILKVSRLLGITENSLKIYIGDDLTDEDAFEVLGEKDISVVVGHKESSRAQYFCKNSGEVEEFLETVCEITKNG